LVKFGQVWSSLVKFGQHLDEVVQKNKIIDQENNFSYFLGQTNQTLVKSLKLWSNHFVFVKFQNMYFIRPIFSSFDQRLVQTVLFVQNIHSLTKLPSKNHHLFKLLVFDQNIA